MVPAVGDESRKGVSLRRVPLRYPPNSVPLVSRVRSTLVSSSVRVVIENGRLDEYKEHLPLQLHPAIFDAIAGSWIDIDVALSHYRAVDALQLPASDQVSMGESVGRTVRNYLIGTGGQSAPAEGATPWDILQHTQRTWDRLYVGGDVSIEETGPKQFVRTMYGLPLCEVPYFRHASRGIMRTVISRWCTKCEVSEVAWTPTTLEWQVSWM
jgi:hypothetical protein